METKMDQFIRMSEIALAEAPVVLKTVVGSCIALCLWDPGIKLGGMAHIMLPQRNGDANAPEGKYADTAVKALIRDMKKSGANTARIQAMFAGGASMFLRSKNGGFSVGDRNIDAVRELLEEHKISLSTESVGGTTGRKVMMDCSNGAVTILTLQQKMQMNN